MRKNLKIPKLTVYVISSSQLGAKEKHTAHAIELMNGPGVLHYWDGHQHVGAAYQNLVDLDQPVWDFWMLYRPGVTWGTDGAPAPDWWEHQLGALRSEFGERWLDAQRFADKALELSRSGGRP